MEVVTVIISARYATVLMVTPIMGLFLKKEPSVAK